MSPRFVFTACQAGSEAVLKQEVARRHPALRFAFSRPGFCTFRLPEMGGDAAPQVTATFARTSGASLGRVNGADDAELAAAASSLLAERAPHSARHLHIWRRDQALPGDPGFDPNVNAGAGNAMLALRPGLAVNEHTAAGSDILDCVIVEPDEWWLGWHRASAEAPQSGWPGGVPNVAAPAGMISRAYLKMTEALLWSGLPLTGGDRCVEIGSAPGGSCLAVLERGCAVVGLDPAEMDAAVLSHPRFTHVRARAKDAKRSVFDGCRWLMSDANVAPTYTLDAVEPIVSAPGARVAGLLLTLKLTDPRHASALPAFEERVRGWGYPQVRARQLAFNRREVCLAATGREFL
ncbi:MAG TPA: SAM-dependent methyltransferase [Gammaproteobacteria bacterium]|nr:SAM-dependent methyltransferase [Gammaproteobacteria bacterium]